MQTKYETDKKEQVIKRQQRERLFGFVLIGVITLVAFLLYRGYVNKNKMNGVLQERNEEKDFLLKEIHHRVKNNLQILSSLLSLQSAYIKDESAMNAIQEGRSRVESMGMIHQRLYTNDSVTSVEMNEYVKEHCSRLEDTFSALGQSIHQENKMSTSFGSDLTQLGHFRFHFQYFS